MPPKFICLSANGDTLSIKDAAFSSPSCNFFFRLSIMYFLVYLTRENIGGFNGRCTPRYWKDSVLRRENYQRDTKKPVQYFHLFSDVCRIFGTLLMKRVLF